jgi:hypothetical protein
MIEDFDGWMMWWMILWVDVDMRDAGGFELVSRYQATIGPIISFSYFTSDVYGESRGWTYIDQETGSKNRPAEEEVVPHPNLLCPTLSGWVGS